ncbi:MAG: hypothetical protein GY725_01375, partial [bacterium]|nr:hypothetical protein [bacterium]
MSTILDALRKLQTERESTLGERQPSYEPMPRRQRRKTAPFLLAIGLGLAVFAGGGAFWLMRTEDDSGGAEFAQRESLSAALSPKTSEGSARVGSAAIEELDRVLEQKQNAQRETAERVGPGRIAAGSKPERSAEASQVPPAVQPAVVAKRETPPPAPAVVAKRKTPPPAPAVVAKRKTPPPAPAVVAKRKTA